MSLKVKHSGSFNETLKNYTCKGKIYDQFCPDVHEFESAPVTVDVIPAQPIEGPGKYGFVITNICTDLHPVCSVLS